MSDVAELVRLLDLEQIEPRSLPGRPADSGRARVYGGQVAAQALVAGIRTVDPAYAVHSLHSYFLRGGDYSVPIVYDVERIRDGRAFQTRRVVARQHGRPIYYQTLDFQRPEEGYGHPGRDARGRRAGAGASTWSTLMRSGGNTEADASARSGPALDVRYLGNTRTGLPAHHRYQAQAQMWVRIREELPSDPVVHLAAFTYASDVSLLGASLAAHDANPSRTQMASLDHTIWFHRPFRADEWWLYDQWSPSARGARGLSLGRVFLTDGTLVATLAQEGLIRPPPSTPVEVRRTKS